MIIICPDLVAYFRCIYFIGFDCLQTGQCPSILLLPGNKSIKQQFLKFCPFQSRWGISFVYQLERFGCPDFELQSILTLSLAIIMINFSLFSWQLPLISLLIFGLTCIRGFPANISCLRFGRFLTKSTELILFSEISNVSKVFKVTSGNAWSLLQERSRTFRLFRCLRMSAGRSSRP